MADSISPIHPSKTPPQKAQQQSPTTPFSNFIHKAVFVCVLIALLPIFPPHSPELASKTILARSWELLHLLLVGIAISYGLFSRRNSDHDADTTPTPHSSYVPRALHVSSVFGDEEPPVESPRGPPESSDEKTKTQTWNYSRYNPGEPVVMVAEESSSSSTTDGSKSSTTTKPLFLPVRSLKSTQGDDGDGVLPSPVPWRSRSGRMEVKEAAPSPPIPAAEAELGEDSGRKKSLYKSSPPPAPPLPHVHGHNIATEKKDGRKSLKYELKHLSMRGIDPPAPDNQGRLRDKTDKILDLDNPSLLRTTTKSQRDLQEVGVEGDPPESTNNKGQKTTKISAGSNNPASRAGSADNDGPYIGRSVRTVRAKEPQRQGWSWGKSDQTSDLDNLPPLRTTLQVEHDLLQEVKAASNPPRPAWTTKISSSLGNPTLRTDTVQRLRRTLPTSRTKKKKDEFREKMIIESDSSSDSDAESEISDVGELPKSGLEEENEVDKKADEFIAKFREQIRLQRITSIKRSAAQRNVTSRINS